MAIYENFSQVYTSLFDTDLYLEWANFVDNQIRAAFDKSTDQIKLLDLACGNGSFLEQMLLKGYQQVAGLDLSADMIDLAKQKLNKYNLGLPLVVGDMASFSLSQPVDVITILCDSLCYLADWPNTKQCLASAYHSLQPGGLLIFDIHSQKKINLDFPGYSYIEEWDDLVFTWSSQQYVGPDTIEHVLNIFAKVTDQDYYQRFEEVHQERTYPIHQLEAYLNQLGFDQIKVSADFTNRLPDENSERIFFTAQKKE
ncbi:hypothetical protein AWM75_06500 [Aerococcus urinaehominis]|uniref:Uncharacterized protein n=1 Tax=Aerococcus urinaehominis TaxID=128944 RepID=A0A0X8FLT4_9LACT|nr:class I SAM-dependent methyltransferase [Aerococcus urinaehominis]AMB99650.1 hypothetical protein AWM75_06500 [Aerococcus urinaehominis]SDL88951.1 Methyltransferase domain-containing protein [Aerococcus urinaehominis]